MLYIKLHLYNNNNIIVYNLWMITKYERKYKCYISLTHLEFVRVA